MKVNMYSIQDIKTGIYFAPSPAHNDAAASRGFTEIFNNPQSTFHKFPDDYLVTKVGEFDDKTGIMISCSPEIIGTARDLIIEYQRRQKELYPAS